MMCRLDSESGSTSSRQLFCRMKGLRRHGGFGVEDNPSSRIIWVSEQILG